MDFNYMRRFSAYVSTFYQSEYPNTKWSPILELDWSGGCLTSVILPFTLTALHCWFMLVLCCD